ncbi:hypothetical protein DYD21_14515 [Rhodohalobacter sp. SW132]|nr:hypothetical protein [Rhodohalobacter sp. SW132]REL29072.1 hypothetical protein DYD21_14515 [Rhodohalobacter sp. SW132]
MILLGAISYIATGAASATALIPAFFGIVFVALGILGTRNESMRKHVMHAALLLAILGLGGSFGGLMSVLGVLTGGELERPAAAYAQAVMAILCIFFIVAGVKSFINARKQPKADTEFEDG